MKEFCFLLIFCVWISSTEARNVVQTLSVSNGGRWGTWRREEYCPPGEYAIGYQMKIEEKQGRDHDDSSLNGIKLMCMLGSTISSEVGPWGDWGSFSNCSFPAEMIAFRLQVEPPQGTGVWFDDSAANFIKFLCRDNFNGDTMVRAVSPRRGFWGRYGGWSRKCGVGAAICGMQTRMERPQGYYPDDTALNDVRFFCCDD